MSANSKENIGLRLPFKGTGGIIYNVTVKVEKNIANDWIQWLVQKHGPAIIATDCFSKFTALKLLDYDDEESTTYAIQYFADTIEGYQTYIDQFADYFRKQAFYKWGNRFVAFRTVMEVIH